MAYMSKNPSDLVVHIVEQKSSVDALIDYLYETPDETTITHFKWINNHLRDGIARPGQVVLIYPPGTSTCSPEELAFRDVAEQVDKTLAAQSNSERQLLVKH